MFFFVKLGKKAPCKVKFVTKPLVDQGLRDYFLSSGLKNCKFQYELPKKKFGFKCQGKCKSNDYNFPITGNEYKSGIKSNKICLLGEKSDVQAQIIRI